MGGRRTREKLRDGYPFVRATVSPKFVLHDRLLRNESLRFLHLFFFMGEIIEIFHFFFLNDLFSIYMGRCLHDEVFSQTLHFN